MSKTTKKPRESNKNEVWRPIKDFEGLYEVSNLGNVRSIKSGEFKQAHVGTTGYLYVNLWKNNRQKLCTIHRLVALSFIQEIKGKPYIDHINTIKTDNRVENLRWCTHKENCNNPISVKKSSISHKGHVNEKESIEKWKISIQKWRQSPEYTSYIQRMRNRAKNVEQISKDGKIIHVFNSTIEAGESVNLNPKRIYSVLNNPKRTAGGFLWRTINQSIG